MLVSLLALGACGLPRSGPTKSEIYAGSVLREGDAFVIDVTDRVNQVASSRSGPGFSAALRNAGRLGADTIRPGDTLALQIWENVDQGLLSSAGTNATALTEIQVDEQGFIFVPYAGRIRAAGNSPEAIRRIITNKLSEQTPDPQVQVARAAGEGATVTILGTGGAQGVVPIERSTRTLSSLLAKAGGIDSDGSAISVTLMRGNTRETVYFEDIVSDPSQDIALRDGDRIILEKDQRHFTAFGATGAQTEVPFNRANISLMEALAQIGGLNPSTADPTGLFVLRNESEAVTEAITGVDVTGAQRVVYVLNLTSPNGLFRARDFLVRGGDTIYVTEAPLVQFNKTVAAVTGSLGRLNAAQSAVQSTTGGLGL